MRLTTGLCFLIQPVARLYGRVEYSLTSLRWRGFFQFIPPWGQSFSKWFEQWQPGESHLEAVEKSLRMEGAPVLRGGDFDRWDLEVRGGLLGSARLIMGIEEFGGGKQLLRYRIRPHFSRGGSFFSIAWLSFSILALMNGAFIPALVLGLLGTMTASRMLFESTAQMALLRSKFTATEPLTTNLQPIIESPEPDIA